MVQRLPAVVVQFCRKNSTYRHLPDWPSGITSVSSLIALKEATIVILVRFRFLPDLPCAQSNERRLWTFLSAFLPKPLRDCCSGTVHDMRLLLVLLPSWLAAAKAVRPNLRHSHELDHFSTPSPVMDDISALQEQSGDAGYLVLESTTKGINDEGFFTYPPGPTRQSIVEPILSSIEMSNLKKYLDKFTSFHNRYYNSDYGKEASDWLFDTVQGIIAASPSNASVTVEQFKHGWKQSSIITKFPGRQDGPITILGAHLDSVNWEDEDPIEARAPGADDDGSGSIGLLEVFRVLASTHFQPLDAVEFHWYSADSSTTWYDRLTLSDRYSAEEPGEGLLGSGEIAASYKKNGVVVKAEIIPSMTSKNPQDWTNRNLNIYMISLADEYISTPVKIIGEVKPRVFICGFRCSDHASWNISGYPTTTPFESLTEDQIPVKHTAHDTTSLPGFSWTHMLEHAKLAAAFAVELGNASLALSFLYFHLPFTFHSAPQGFVVSNPRKGFRMRLFTTLLVFLTAIAVAHPTQHASDALPLAEGSQASQDGFLLREQLSGSVLDELLPEVLPRKAVGGGDFSYPLRPTMQSTVRSIISSLAISNLQRNLDKLTSFHNRYYDSDYGKEASDWLCNIIQGIIETSPSNASATIEQFKHAFKQSSIIARFRGRQDGPITIIGAHIDSVNWKDGNPVETRAPGADDDASGCVALLEVFRALAADSFQPLNTVEFHWYSAEEELDVGLLGSRGVVASYQQKGTTVKGMLQLDSIAYVKPGTEEVIRLTQDHTSVTLNAYIPALITEYNAIPVRSYGRCGFDCSDHVSWTLAGYPASVFVGAIPENKHPLAHTAEDTTNYPGFSWTHILEFSKLVAAFAVELGNAPCVISVDLKLKVNDAAQLSSNMSTAYTNTILNTMKFVVRPSEQRGHADHGWLKTFHTFSFATHQDTEHEQFGHLRVINEDRVAPRTGFGTHSHREFEIFSYLVQGELEHKDSMGNTEILRRGDVQLTSAGTGISHSEKSHGPNEVHFLQIWSFPKTPRLQPKYYTRHFSDEEKKDQWAKIVAPAWEEGVKNDREAEGPAPVHSDLTLYATLLSPGKGLDRPLQGRKGYIQVVQTSGYNPRKAEGATVRISNPGSNPVELKEGDGAYIFVGQKGNVLKVENVGDEIGEVLVFDLD
ncbi:hypothetical protein NP233_g3906 [Leucocoprinus birnbaumii]|uniref:Peptide hydrolase n=1 Tax=Leucocoprinus birnbaumii TaxID=56174 RepID=A0AAD5W2A7_9AGAR|nr:hypothetical protein NP233_g3906 [Leucocoprinus birnbaumii]